MNVYKRLLQYIKPYRFGLGISIALMVLSAGAEVLVSGVIYITTNGLINREVASLEGIPHLPSQLAISFSVKWIPVIIIWKITGIG